MNELDYFQGYIEKLIRKDTKSFKLLVNNVPFTVKCVNKISGSCLINIDIVYPFYAVVKCQEHTVIEHSKDQYEVLQPDFSFYVRFVVLGPSKIINPVIQNVTIYDADGHWRKIPPNAVILKEITVLDDLKFVVQITSDGEGNPKYFIKNPYPHVWINPIHTIDGPVPPQIKWKGDIAAETDGPKIRLTFIYDKDKKHYNAKNRRDNIIKNSIVLFITFVLLAMTIGNDLRHSIFKNK